MKKEQKKSLIIWLVVAAVVGLLFYQWYRQKSPATDELTIALAQCLTQNGAKMYGAFWCPHCLNQKKAFDSAWQYVNYIECSNRDNTQTKECRDAGIEGYPTWEFKDGSRLSGELSFSALAQAAGCPF